MYCTISLIALSGIVTLDRAGVPEGELLGDYKTSRVHIRLWGLA